MPDHPSPKGYYLIAGAPIVAGIEKNRFKTGKHKLKVKYLLGARTDDMYDYMKPLLWKLPD